MQISKRLIATTKRSILAADERPLQVDLVCLDRTVPAAGCVGRREPCPRFSSPMWEKMVKDADIKPN
jgi:hypothetical protein